MIEAALRLQSSKQHERMVTGCLYIITYYSYTTCKKVIIILISVWSKKVTRKLIHKVHELIDIFKNPFNNYFYQLLITYRFNVFKFIKKT